MQLAAPAARAAQPAGSARPSTRTAATRRSGSMSPFSATQPAASGGVGDKLLPLLRSPFDLLALGPRVALGLSSSLPELLEKM